MKKINKITAAIAVALSVGITAPASAEIEFHPDGRGDALLFPVYNGNVENYFTIMNNHDAFIQGHLRFRGAAWSGELRDFDVILSPGDVFVFRLADIDGDGEWEIDQSLDIKNFQYTGLGEFTCGPVTNTDIKYPQCMDLSHDLVPTAAELLESFVDQTGKVTIPSPFTRLEDAQAVINHQLSMGYVEFIGEAVLDGLNYRIMEILLSNNPGDWEINQTKAFNGRGTSAWAWSDAANGFENNRGLSDVPNALTGTAFITIPGVGHGLAYNASALVNFRTATYQPDDKSRVLHVVSDDGKTVTYTENYSNCAAGSATFYPIHGVHRIDNYRRILTATVTHDHPNQYYTSGNTKTLRTDYCSDSEDRAVILHHDDGASPALANSPAGDYVYAFVDNRSDEARISFNNTWGPTLSDGDDYDMTGLRPVVGNDDDFDGTLGVHGLGVSNSIAEVEEAIRLGLSKNRVYQPGSQIFTSYYMADDLFDKSCEGNGTQFNGLPSNAKGFCPDIPLVRSQPEEVSRSILSSYYLAFFPTKFFYGEDSGLYATNNFEYYRDAAIFKLLGLAKSVNLEVWDIFERIGRGTVQGSSCVSPATSCTQEGPAGRVFGYELNFLSIHDLKNFVGGDLVKTFSSGRVVIGFIDNNPNNDPRYEVSWPGLMYTFEWDGALNLAHWRPMQRMHR